MSRCWADEHHLWTEPAFKESSRDCLGRAQQDSPTDKLMGGEQLNESQYTTLMVHWKKKGKSGCDHVSVSARAFRPDCLFPSKYLFGDGTTGSLGEGLVGRRIIWHCTGNPDKSKHSYLLQHKNALGFKRTKIWKRVHQCMPNCHGDSH